MSAIREYWKANRKVHEEFIECPRLKCADGFTMSVQASKFHYCSPRMSLPNGGYVSYELGLPNRRESLLQEYAEEPKRLTKTVYGWVPEEVIDSVIEKHGGLIKESPNADR